MRIIDRKSDLTGKIITNITFDSLSELVETSITNSVRDLDNTYITLDHERMVKHGGDWYEGKNLQEIIADFHHTPAAMMRAIEQTTDSIEAALGESLAPVPRRTVKHKLTDGSELNVDAWLNYDLECWSDVVKPPKHDRVLRICVDSSIASGRNATELMWRGVCAATIVDLLAARNQFCEVFARLVTSKPSRQTEKLSMEVCVKELTAAADIGQICYATGSIGFVRAMFVKSIAKYTKGKVSIGLGHVMHTTSTADYDVVISSGVFNRETTIAAVMAQLKKLE